MHELAPVRAYRLDKNSTWAKPYYYILSHVETQIPQYSGIRTPTRLISGQEGLGYVGFTFTAPHMRNHKDHPQNKIPNGPSSKYFRTLVPKTIPLMA